VCRVYVWGRETEKTGGGRLTIIWTRYKRLCSQQCNVTQQ